MPFVEFPTNKTELNAVFDIFDKSNTGMLDYSEFIEALRPDRTVSNFIKNCMYTHRSLISLLYMYHSVLFMSHNSKLYMSYFVLHITRNSLLYVSCNSMQLALTLSIVNEITFQHLF